jgi:hypothetical protein
MADLQVTCVNKPDRLSTHEAITYLGGYGWRWTRQQVVDAIKARTSTFYTYVGGKRADIEARVSPNGTEYIQSHADGYWNNNLLALKECPIS